MIHTKKKYGFKRFLNKVILYLGAKIPFISMEIRAKIAQLGGVNILVPSTTRIGVDVYFDDINPQDITVGANTIITSGCKILSHFATGEFRDYIYMKRGEVVIGENVFIGMNTVIAKPISIGDGAIIGANSVVICDIPPYTIWGGNPARFLKNRGLK